MLIQLKLRFYSIVCHVLLARAFYMTRKPRYSKVNRQELSETFFVNPKGILTEYKQTKKNHG